MQRGRGKINFQRRIYNFSILPLTHCANRHHYKCVLSLGSTILFLSFAQHHLQHLSNCSHPQYSSQPPYLFPQSSAKMNKTTRLKSLKHKLYTSLEKYVDKLQIGRILYERTLEPRICSLIPALISCVILGKSLNQA